MKRRALVLSPEFKNIYRGQARHLAERTTAFTYDISRGRWYNPAPVYNANSVRDRAGARAR
jgi:hypothetical protein